MDSTQLDEKVKHYERRYRNMLKSIWDEKREKKLGIEEQKYVLCVYFDKPSYDIGAFYNQLIDFLKNSDPIVASTWASEWGKTRIALSPRGESGFKFERNNTNEKLKYQPIFTARKSYPSLMMYTSRPETDISDYYIVLNDSKKITMEAAYIQIVRMVDELIWTMALEMKRESNAITNIGEAYKVAIEYISSLNISIKYSIESSILDKRLINKEDIVRLYGDIHDLETVPWVIGLISESPFKTGLTYVHRRENNNSKLTFLASYTTGKRPHVGHLFLFSRIRALSLFMGDNTEVVIEMNDTGERFENLLEVAISDLEITNKQGHDKLIKEIIEGQYSIEDIEKWYVRRKDKSKLYNLSQKNPIQMPLRQQAETAFNMLTHTFSGFHYEYLLSSELDSEELLKYSNREWQHTGFENMNKYILRRNGKPTALLARMNFINEIIKNRKGTIVYVDSSNAIKNAIALIGEITGKKIQAVSGAAVGFDFVIHSGSKSKEELLLTSFNNWYESQLHCPLDELVDDINVLTTYLPIHRPNNRSEEGYYNFKKIYNLKNAIKQAHQKRAAYLEKLKNASVNIVIGDESIVNPELPSYVKKEVKYALRKFIKRAKYTFDKNEISVKSYYAAIAEQPENLSGANAKFNNCKYTQAEKLYLYLIDCLESDVDFSSATIDALLLEGYSNKSKLIAALQTLFDQKIELKYQLTYSQILLSKLILILDNCMSLSQEDAELVLLLIDRYLDAVSN